MLLDGDLGLANVDVFLGLSPRLHDGATCWRASCTLEEIMRRCAARLNVVPAASGIAELANLPARSRTWDWCGLQRPDHASRHDVVDTAAGIAASVLQFSQAAQHVLVVVCDEPASHDRRLRAHQNSLAATTASAVPRAREPDRGRRRRQTPCSSKLRARGHPLPAMSTLDYVGEIPEDPFLQPRDS